MTYDLASLRAELTADHGRSTYPYGTSTGLHIGIGHSLAAHGLSDAAIDFILAEDVDRAASILDARMGWWRDLPPRCQRVMLALTLRPGMGALQGARRFIAAMERHDWRAAADELRDADMVDGDRLVRLVGRLVGSE